MAKPIIFLGSYKILIYTLWHKTSQFPYHQNSWTLKQALLKVQITQLRYMCRIWRFSLLKCSNKCKEKHLDGCTALPSWEGYRLQNVIVGLNWTGLCIMYALIKWYLWSCCLWNWPNYCYSNIHFQQQALKTCLTAIDSTFSSGCHCHIVRSTMQYVYLSSSYEMSSRCFELEWEHELFGQESKWMKSGRYMYDSMNCQVPNTQILNMRLHVPVLGKSLKVTCVPCYCWASFLKEMDRNKI